MTNLVGIARAEVDRAGQIGQALTHRLCDEIERLRDVLTELSTYGIGGLGAHTNAHKMREIALAALGGAVEPRERQVTTVGGLEMYAVMHPHPLDTAPEMLLPCPICGHEAAFNDGERRGHDHFTVAVYCSNTSCAIRTPQHYKTRESAADAWNRRSEK